MVVPAVTDENMSVPGSRSTGADSPVIADSLTNATPSITSPSAGMMSAFSTRTTSPLRNAVAGTLLDSAVGPHAPGSKLDLGPTQERRLRLAATFGERFRQVCEPDGQEQNEREHAVIGVGGARWAEQVRGRA